MSIEEDLKSKLKNNQRAIFVTDADDLLAAWRHRREKSPGSRSFDFSRVPKEYRLSAPPHERAALMPCHVSVRCHRSHMTKTIKPAPEYTTSACHGHGRTVHLSTQDLDALDTVSFAKRNVAPYISPIMDTATLSLVCNDLGITARAIPKVINGRQYIAFSGHSGLRTMFPGTIYSANNRKIITMAIGALGIKNMVKSGGILTICLTVPLTVLEAFLSDHATCYDLASDLAYELGKIGISALMGYIAGILVGTWTTIVFWPVVIAIGVGIGAGYLMDKVDVKYQLAEKLSAIFEDMSKQIEKSAKNTIHDVQRSAYRGLGGFIRLQGYRGHFNE
jgi:hypothetical protein